LLNKENGREALRDSSLISSAEGIHMHHQFKAMISSYYHLKRCKHKEEICQQHTVFLQWITQKIMSA